MLQYYQTQLISLMHHITDAFQFPNQRYIMVSTAEVDILFETGL